MYSVLVQVPSAQSSSTGNYGLTVWDATVHNFQANLNQTEYGQINSPFDTDRWTFSAQADTQIQFNLLGAANPETQFSLSGPTGFSGFTGLSSSSGLITLSTSGTYTLTVTTGGSGNGSYAFELVQTSQTTLTLGTPYQGTLAGSGQAELFVVIVPTIEPLAVELQDKTSSDQNEVYLKYGSPPTRSEYDYRDSNLAAANQRVHRALGRARGLVRPALCGSASAGSTFTITAAAGSSLFSATPTIAATARTSS